MSLRVILDLNGRDVYWQMAIDEALLYLRLNNSIPDTLRIYRLRPSAVTIGYFQAIRESINLDYLLTNRIDFTRRITGGGAVYHDMNGEITYSIVLKTQGDLVDVLDSYRIICSGLIHALREHNVEASFVPINDIVVSGRKISGSAQTRRHDTLLQHGTLMYATDIDILEKTLVVPRVKLESKGVKSIRERVVTLRDIIGEVDLDKLVKSLIKGFSKVLHRDIVIDEYREVELRTASNILSKYRDIAWIYKR
ncbi:MAG: biotin/lipoate A/B protein ligase family protein [Desulfurococcaceae archaeon]